MSEVRKTFNEFADGKDHLLPDDLAKALRSVGRDVTDAEVKDLIKKMDTNGDGKIQFDEFKDYYLTPCTT